MDKMKYERLGNIVTITSGGTPLTSNKEYYVNGNIPWVKTGDLKVKYLVEIPEKITRLGITNSSAKIFPINTVLVAMYGATIGACSILKTEASTNQACAALLPTKSIDHEYLYYCLRSIRSKLINKGIGGGQPNISATILKNTKIPFPFFEDQIRIATILSKADELIRQRQESIALLDEFLKSTFLEMFGDFGKSTTSKKELLGNNISFLTSGSRGWAKYYSTSGVKFLRIQNIGGGTIRTDNLIYVNPPKSAESKRIIVEEGDLIISITADLGRASVVPKNFGEAYISQHLALIRLNKNVNPIYAAYFYNMPYGNNSIQKKNRSAVKAGLNFNDVKSFPIIIPDLKKQNEFAQIVEKTEALKKQYQASLEELEQLFGSLSQRVFKGELDLSQVKVEKDKHLIKGINWSKIEQDYIELSQKIKSNKSLPDDYVRGEWKDKIEYEEILNWENRPYFHEMEKVRDLIRFVDKTNERLSFKNIEYEFTKRETFKENPKYDELRDFIFEELSSEQGILEQVFDDLTQQVYFNIR